MIVITNPTPLENEIKIIHSLFEEGLELLHIRKPNYTEADMVTFLSKIRSEYSNRLVLHQHHQLAEPFEISRIHYSRKERIQSLKSPFKVLNIFRTPTLPSRHFGTDRVKSTSVHSIASFNAVNYGTAFRVLRLESKPTDNFDYAFLSPVYPSISKSDYVSKKNLVESVKQRTNFSTKLVALGGITPENIKEALENGFDDVAILGTIWNSNNPIENFKQCQEIALSHSL